MSIKLSQQEIGRRIMELRKNKDFSQEDLAKFLKIPRSSVAQMELGNRNVLLQELLILAEALSFSLDEFLSKDFQITESKIKLEKDKKEKQEVRISIPQLKVSKFKNILLYILERCAGKPNVGETVLYKLLYFSDFNYYELYEEQLTGATYRKLPYGPVPQKLDSIVNQMIDTKQLQKIKTIYHGYPQTRYIPLEKADLTELKASEKEIIDKVIEQLSDWTASAISEYSHKDMPWKATDEGQIIDYELSFYRDHPYSVRNYFEEEKEQP